MPPLTDLTPASWQDPKNIAHHGTSIPSRIEACEGQRYHYTRSIQPHGVLLAFHPASRRIMRVSANAAGSLHRPPEELLGMTLPQLLTAETVCAIDLEVAIYQENIDIGRSSIVLTFLGPHALRADAYLYCSGALFCIEFVPLDDDQEPEETEHLSSRFLEMADQIGNANIASSALAAVVCTAIQEITGFDRIYYCQFDRIGHGHVLGESNAGIMPTLLNHHFPATDVPRAAREIYLRNPFRLVPDIDAQPVDIIGDEEPMDLTMSMFRSVAPTHLGYVRNMGVQASVSFSVVADGELHALFGGHHHCPRTLSVRKTTICQHLVALYVTRYEYLKLREERNLVGRQLESLHALTARFRQADDDFGACIAANHELFHDLMRSSDLLCRFEDKHHHGCSLDPGPANQLLDFLSAKLPPGTNIYHTNHIGQEDPAFAALCPTVAGVLAISLDLSGRNILAWLRPETVLTQEWSGNPMQPAIIDARGDVGPRISFDGYIRETRGTSIEWSSTDIEVARQSRYAFSQLLAAHYERAMRLAAEQTNALKSEFIANISHELRSPMHAVIGLSSILRAADETLSLDKRVHYAGTIHDCGTRLLRLIDDLLDLSRLEAGKMSFDFSLSDILTTIEQAIDEVRPLASTKSIEIRYDRGSGSLDCRHDTVRMRQVVINLVANAVKFSPVQTTVNISSRITGNDPDNRELVIEIADQGPGIPDAELDAIFDKFTQSSRTQSGAGGTGLGLSICREIVTAHQGRIWALNNQSGGASLLVSLPIINDDNTEVLQ